MGRRTRLLIAAALIVAALVIGFVARGWVTGPSATIPPAASEGASPSLSARGRIGLPDPVRTPGAINPDVNQDNIDVTICQAGWTATVRPSVAYTGPLKAYQIFQYGYSDKNPTHYEEDHLVALELGGAPRDQKNLWPQPDAVTLADGRTIGSDAKDHLEDTLNAKVCAREMPLVDAQRMIATDWIAAWEAEGEP